MTTAELESAQEVVQHPPRRRKVRDTRRTNLVAMPWEVPGVGVEECILLFGAFCNGKMEDVVQPRSMERLLASVAAEGQCFYHAHSGDETTSRGSLVGEFYGQDRSKLISLSHEDAWKVNKFKALIIGGGGIFAAMNPPLFQASFVQALDLPIVIMGVRANHRVGAYALLLEKAAFVSGRDASSVARLANVLQFCRHPEVKPAEVHVVRDPLLSDRTLTDTDGVCWEQSEGDRQQPLCFVLPSGIALESLEAHRRLVDHVVRPGDRFINVFPKFQQEIEKLGYPETVEEILDPTEYTKELCSCKAIISTSFHAAVLGLHMGVPTFGAFPRFSPNKFPELMIDLMSLPDQFFFVDENLTRDAVDWEVDSVRRLYLKEGRRGAIYARLSQFYEEFQAHAHQVLYYAIGVKQQQKPWQLVGGGSNLTRPSAGAGAGREQETAGLGLDSAAGGTSVASSGLAAAGSVGDATSPGFFFLSPRRAHSAATGGDCVVATLLLFAFVGLALLPSAANGTRNLRQRSSRDDDEDAIQTFISEEATDTSRGLSRNQGNGDTRSPSSSDAGSGNSELGGLVKRPKTASLMVVTLQTLRRRIFVVGGKGATVATPRKHLRSETVFVLNFALWVGLAVMFSVYSKSYLEETHDPAGLLVLQGTTGFVVLLSLGCLGMGGSGISNHPELPGVPAHPISVSRRANLAAIIHVGQALLTNICLFRGGDAVVMALRAAEPVAAALLSYFFLGKSASLSSMVSFATIVAGVLLVTKSGGGGGSSEEASEAERGGCAAWIGEGDFYSCSKATAFLATLAVCFNALRNVLMKTSDPVAPHQTLASYSLASGEIGVVILLVRLFLKKMDETIPGREVGGHHAAREEEEYGNWLTVDGVIASLCFVGYNLASFNLLAGLSPVAHAVGNTVKTMVVFASGMLFLGEAVTGRQLAGAAVAAVGVTVYNVGKRKNSMNNQ